jgi:hypothetical protein
MKSRSTGGDPGVIFLIILTLVMAVIIGFVLMVGM